MPIFYSLPAIDLLSLPATTLSAPAQTSIVTAKLGATFATAYNGAASAPIATITAPIASVLTAEEIVELKAILKDKAEDGEVKFAERIRNLWKKVLPRILVLKLENKDHTYSYPSEVLVKNPEISEVLRPSSASIFLTKTFEVTTAGAKNVEYKLRELAKVDGRQILDDSSADTLQRTVKNGADAYMVLLDLDSETIKALIPGPDFTKKGLSSLSTERYVFGTRKDATVSLDGTPPVLQKQRVNVLEHVRAASFSTTSVGQQNGVRLNQTVDKFVLNEDTGLIEKKAVRKVVDVQRLGFNFSAKNLAPDLSAYLFGQHVWTHFDVSDAVISTNTQDPNSKLKFDFSSIYEADRNHPTQFRTSITIDGDQQFNSPSFLGVATIKQLIPYNAGGKVKLGGLQSKNLHDTLPTLDFSIQMGGYHSRSAKVFGSSNTIARALLRLDSRAQQFLPYLKLRATANVYFTPYTNYSGSARNERNIWDDYRLSVIFPTRNEALSISYISGFNASRGFERRQQGWEFSVGGTF